MVPCLSGVAYDVPGQRDVRTDMPPIRALEEAPHSAAYDCQPRVPLGPMSGHLLSRMPNLIRERGRSTVVCVQGHPARPVRDESL